MKEEICLLTAWHLLHKDDCIFVLPLHPECFAAVAHLWHAHFRLLPKAIHCMRSVVPPQWAYSHLYSSSALVQYMIVPGHSTLFGNTEVFNNINIYISQILLLPTCALQVSTRFLPARISCLPDGRILRCGWSDLLLRLTSPAPLAAPAFVTAFGPAPVLSSLSIGSCPDR